MSSLFGSMGGGPSERPPAIHGPAVAGQSSRIQHQQEIQHAYKIRHENVKMVPLTLVRTTVPVWPEDEEVERESSKDASSQVPRLASAELAEQMAKEIRVELPDRLLGNILKLPPNPWLDTAEHDYFSVCVPTTFSSQFNIIPRRLRLLLTLEDATEAEPQLVPIACQLHPGTKVATEITNVGEFKIDLGQAFSWAVQALCPGMPDLLTARVGGSLDLKKVRARVQAAGLNTHKCEWRIADTKIAYDFNPACIIQVPKGVQLAVKARLHVEARKKIAKVFFRNYFSHAEPMRYVLSKASGEAVSTDTLSHTSQVTLRQPGVLYSDERTIYSYGRFGGDVSASLTAAFSAEDAASDFFEAVGSPAFPPPGSSHEGATNFWFPGLEATAAQVSLDTGDLDVKPPLDAPSASSEKIIPGRASQVDELFKLTMMLEKGLLTRHEFEQLKAKLIADW